MRGVLYSDGGCRPSNPGDSGFAAVLTLDDGTVHQVARYLGWHSNNHAEYCGLVVGLKMALDNNVTDIFAYTDSQLLCGQLAKGWKCNVDDLRVLNREAQKLLAKFDSWELSWIRRERNKVADKLCTEIILAKQSNNPFLHDLVKPLVL